MDTLQDTLQTAANTSLSPVWVMLFGLIGVFTFMFFLMLVTKGVKKLNDKKVLKNLFPENNDNPTDDFSENKDDNQCD